ncbi:dienelactone hydrolase family protein [Methylobacter sp. BlB1]|uniref:dienelactone hydrolase family protein n=1 Tax=Methylobacter sp. BlB1 TaxID=2785914 RepID=UPI001892E25A|nr:dienelactone hydrolase family protein [Methylobacter sp. BlB1]MBF6650963.1 dienelactone hydrolase family protein [Methylobacter sp. BlB1]
MKHKYLFILSTLAFFFSPIISADSIAHAPRIKHNRVKIHSSDSDDSKFTAPATGDDAPRIKHNYVAFPSFDPDDSEAIPLTISARFAIPTGMEGPVPAVIVVHGSGGVDERGELYSLHLNQAGIATLELDMWAARGLDGGLSRPAHVRETLPDIYGAIQYLQSRIDIQKNQLGLIGFSWGGVVAMLMAGEDTPQSNVLHGLVANYPVCWVYNKVPGYTFNQIQDGRQVLIISGKEDVYDAPDDCTALASSLSDEDRKQVQVLELEDATHAFDLNRPDSLFFDPYAYQGKGGDVPIRYNKEAAEQAVESAIGFMLEQFGSADTYELDAPNRRD